MSLDTIKHYPVMLNEVLYYLKDNSSIIDCTFGGGGYSQAILKKFPNSNLLALDRDPSVKKYSDILLKKYKNSFKFKNLKFSQINQLDFLNEIDFFIFDLGVSHFQLKEASRGFSFIKEGSLDMGMGLNNFNALELVNNATEIELKNIIKTLGEEKFASKIARLIVKERAINKILTTTNLSNIIEKVKFKKNKTNPSTKTFQSLRMVVNQELSEIFNALNFIFQKSKNGSIIIVVSFHSLEDTLVKRMFNHYGKTINSSRYFPDNQHDKNYEFEILTKKPLLPSEVEIKENFSSRSAKLRVIKKIKNPSKVLLRKNLKMEKYFHLEESVNV